MILLHRFLEFFTVIFNRTFGIGEKIELIRSMVEMNILGKDIKKWFSIDKQKTFLKLVQKINSMLENDDRHTVFLTISSKSMSE